MVKLVESLQGKKIAGWRIDTLIMEDRADHGKNLWQCACLRCKYSQYFRENELTTSRLKPCQCADAPQAILSLLIQNRIKESEERPSISGSPPSPIMVKSAKPGKTERSVMPPTLPEVTAKGATSKEGKTKKLPLRESRQLSLLPTKSPVSDLIDTDQVEAVISALNGLPAKRRLTHYQLPESASLLADPDLIVSDDGIQLTDGKRFQSFNPLAVSEPIDLFAGEVIDNPGPNPSFSHQLAEFWHSDAERMPQGIIEELKQRLKRLVDASDRSTLDFLIATTMGPKETAALWFYFDRRRSSSQRPKQSDVERMLIRFSKFLSPEALPEPLLPYHRQPFETSIALAPTSLSTRFADLDLAKSLVTLLAEHHLHTLTDLGGKTMIGLFRSIRPLTILDIYQIFQAIQSLTV